ncbi:MAG: cobalamin biosynthesis protein CobD [Proteobacteria bacterium]|nr:cobalamin biosynthesis protein CobD [Pseudomonadota bacterium]
MSFELALVAVAVEAIVGYPDAVYRAIGHPVTWIGRLIAWCDRTWNSPDQSPDERRLWGVATLALLLLVSIVAGRVLEALLPMAVCAVLASSLLAQRSLHRHVADVADGLERGGLVDGRKAVSMIVGRDPERLDEAGVARAAIESLAENFSDGIVAPLFWLAVAGLPGGIAYKAVNTADSMIGHKSERHLAFGWAAARFDDLVNLPASRLAALWLVAAAGFVPDGSPQRAWATVRRDARFHRSPNAGWPEAAMAGALGLKLNGPRLYDGEVVDDPYMGDGRAEATAADIRRALQLYRIACGIQIAVLAILVVLSLPS